MIWSELAGQMVAIASPEWRHERDVDYLLWLPSLERGRVLRAYPREVAERLCADIERLRDIRKRR